MVTQYKYQLEKGGKKHTCPACGKRTFVRFIDAPGNYMPEKFGRCDRESNCGYFETPYNENEYKSTPITQKETVRQVNIPKDVLNHTLKGYEGNIFIQTLAENVSFPFEAGDLEKAIGLYYLGTICRGYWKGAICFPFIDLKGSIRAIQVKKFNEDNHTTGTTFIHAIIEKHYTSTRKPFPEWLTNYRNPDHKKITCLFGEHLLSKYSNNIALVEAPKSAIYGNLYYGSPEDPRNLLWLAVYNLSSLTYEKVKVLAGRTVLLFPDLSKDGKAFDQWSTKARDYEKLMPGTRFIVSDLLERHADQAHREKGLDLADYLINMDWRKFRKTGEQSKLLVSPDEANKKIIPIRTNLKSVKGEKYEVLKKTFISESWPVEEMENFLRNAKMPDTPIKLNQWATIINPAMFVDSHIDIVRAQNGNPLYQEYFKRLLKLKELLN